MSLIEIIWQATASFVGTVAFAILFEVPRKHYLSCGMVGVAGWLVYKLIDANFHTPVIAIFTSSFILIFLSRELAFRMKAPVTTFLLCGIFCLVPGLGLYQLTYSFMGTNPDPSSIAQIAISVVKSAIAIALGITIGYELPPKCFYYYRKMNKKVRVIREK